MSTASFAGRSSGTTMIAPHATGHGWAEDGTLLRVDCERGASWVATHYDLNLRLIEQVKGSDEEVHRVAACWARGQEKRATRPRRSHLFHFVTGRPWL